MHLNVDVNYCFDFIRKFECVFFQRLCSTVMENRVFQYISLVKSIVASMFLSSYIPLKGECRKGRPAIKVWSMTITLLWKSENLFEL